MPVRMNALKGHTAPQCCAFLRLANFLSLQVCFAIPILFLLNYFVCLLTFYSRFATELITHKEQIYSIVESIDNGYSAERNLYHILCGDIFDGLMFDYLEEKDLVTRSCVHGSGLDYLVIIYEDTKSLNEYSDMLLCSYNRLTINGKGFVSFSDSNGSRKDLYRYRRQMS